MDLWNVGILPQWYSTGGTRRHLRGYVKFKISIYVLFHEWSELQKNISFQSELVLFSISSVPYSTQQWNLAAVLVMLIILWSYNNECHLKCLFVSNADNNSNACEYTLLAQWLQFNVFQVCGHWCEMQVRFIYFLLKARFAFHPVYLRIKKRWTIINAY
jgi:hypothetical protein